MSRRIFTLAFAAAVLTGPATAADPQPVTARLISDGSSPAASASIEIGVELLIEPGWHVYWQNPGEAGLATEVEIEVPAGHESGPLRWPIPDRFIQPGGILGFGYHGSVLFATTVRMPAQSSGPDTVRARASWLACKDICVLGDVELEGRLPLIAAPQRFRDWQRRLPRAAAATDLPFSVSTSPGRTPDHHSLWLRWQGEALPVEWFPNPGSELKISANEPRTRAGLTRVDFSIKAIDSSAPKPTELSSIIVITESTGTRRGFEIPVAIE